LYNTCCHRPPRKRRPGAAKKRRDAYLATILREDIDINALDKYRICSKHFEGGKSAELYDGLVAHTASRS